MVKLIPKIEEKINKVLKEKKLIPLETPEDFIKRTKRENIDILQFAKIKREENLFFMRGCTILFFERERMITEVKLARILTKKTSMIFSDDILMEKLKKILNGF
jgi:hypothetical protein